jgi:hypothetical protein
MLEGAELSVARYNSGAQYAAGVAHSASSKAIPIRVVGMGGSGQSPRVCGGKSNLA